MSSAELEKVCMASRIDRYPVHLHMLPSKASSICSFKGFGLFVRRLLNIKEKKSVLKSIKAIKLLGVYKMFCVTLNKYKLEI